MMLTIITGEIGSGKTARMLEIFHGLKGKGADGIASMKVNRDTEFEGYDLMRLANGERKRLAVRKPLYIGEFERPLFYDQFVFDTDAFLFGTGVITAAIDDPTVEHIFLDEIGPLELEGKGFHAALGPLFKDEVKEKKQVYVCVRDSCVEPVITKYGIKSYVLLR